MLEEYFLVPRSRYLAMIEKYGDWNSIDENQDIISGIIELTKGCTAVDLSDEAIENKSKKASLPFTCKEGETFESRLAKTYYSEALKDLKQILK